jgi:hypothetical protein
LQLTQATRSSPRPSDGDPSDIHAREQIAEFAKLMEEKLEAERNELLPFI